MSTESELYIYNLADILNRLPGRRDELIRVLHSIDTSQHLYLNQWRDVIIHPDVLSNVESLIRRFELNGLQLHGYGCNLLSKILSSDISHLDTFQYNFSNLIELLLRILLEHKKYVMITHILSILCHNRPKHFVDLCTTGSRIIEELPVPVKHENFEALYNFTFAQVAANISHPDIVHAALVFLSDMASITEPTYRSEYRLSCVLPLLLQVLQQHDQKYILIATAITLRRIIVLNEKHANFVLNHDISSHIMKMFHCYVSFSEVDADVVIAVCELYASIAYCEESLTTVSALFSPTELILCLSSPSSALLRSVVLLFDAIAPVLPNAAPDAIQGWVPFVQVLLQCIHDMLQSDDEGVVIIVYRCIRLLSRSLFMRTIFDQTGEINLPIVTALRRELFTHLDVFQVQFSPEKVQLLDAVAAMVGWENICYRTPKKSVFISQLIAAASTRFAMSSAENSDENVSNGLPVETGIARDRHESEGECVVMDSPTSRQTNPSHATINITRQELKEFLDSWEEQTNEELMQWLAKIYVMSRTIGIDGFRDSHDLERLMELLREVLIDDRHGILENDLMSEKCVQLVTDIAVLSSGAREVAATFAEKVVDMLLTWSTGSDALLVESYLSALIVLSSNKSLQRVILDCFSKIHMLLLRVRHGSLFEAVTLLCFGLSKSVKNISSDSESALFGWIVKWLSDVKHTSRVCACSLVSHLGTAHPPLVHRILSRTEIETRLFAVACESNDIYSTLTALRAIAVCAQYFNPRPYWFYDYRVTSSWNNENRYLLSCAFLKELSEIFAKYEEPLSLVVASFCFEIASCIQDIVKLPHDSEFVQTSLSQFITELANLLLVLTRTHVFQATDRRSRHRAESERSSGSAERARADSDALVNLELHGVNTAYDTLAAAAIHTLHTFLFSNTTDLTAYTEWSKYFRATPVCEAVLYLLVQCPNVHAVQSRGIAILRCFAQNRNHVSIIGGCCSKVLINAMANFPDDADVQYSFCIIVDALAVSSEEERMRLFQFHVYKWLYIVMKAAAPDVAPYACIAARHLADTVAHAEVIGNCGIGRVLVQLMDMHPQHMRVQMEGLRCMVALMQSALCARLIKNAGGSSAVSRALSQLRLFVEDPSSVTNIGGGVGNYSVEDVAEVIENSTLLRFKQNKCTIS